VGRQPLPPLLLCVLRLAAPDCRIPRRRHPGLLQDTQAAGLLTSSITRAGGIADLGLAVARARAAGLVYTQHIILIHAAIDGDQLRPFPAPRPRRAGLPAGKPAGRPALAREDGWPPLSVWATAQRDARTQRRGRHLPESMAHPGKMLLGCAIAITRYTAPATWSPTRCAGSAPPWPRPSTGTSAGQPRPARQVVRPGPG
jgi:hypothetical protein